MNKSFLILLIFPAFLSCNSAKEKAKDVVSKAAETAGEVTTEAVKGVKAGIDKSLDCNIELSQSLKDKGIETGKMIISGSTDSSSNILSAYFVFNKDFSSVVSVKIFDKKGLEYGRLQKKIQCKKGEAAFIDFVFDSRTDIENKSKFIIE